MMFDACLSSISTPSFPLEESVFHCATQKFEEAMLELESSNEESSQNPQGQQQPQQQQPMSGGDGDEQGMQGGENGSINPEVDLARRHKVTNECSCLNMKYMWTCILCQNRLPSLAVLKVKQWLDILSFMNI